jgi:hypothetical protein
MGQKNKGAKNAKKDAKRSLKEKRAAKKQKKTGNGSPIRPVQ